VNNYVRTLMRFTESTLVFPHRRLPDSPKLGFRVRVSVSANRDWTSPSAHATRDWRRVSAIKDELINVIMAVEASHGHIYWLSEEV